MQKGCREGKGATVAKRGLNEEPGAQGGMKLKHWNDSSFWIYHTVISSFSEFSQLFPNITEKSDDSQNELPKILPSSSLTGCGIGSSCYFDFQQETMVFLLLRVKLLSKAGEFESSQHTHNQSWLCFFSYTGYWKVIKFLWKAVSNTKQNPERWQDWKEVLKADSQCLESKAFVCTVASFHHLSDHQLFKGCERCLKGSLLLKVRRSLGRECMRMLSDSLRSPKTF